MGRLVATGLAAILALGGCKTTEKKGTDREAPGTAAARAKAKDRPTWLDDLKDLPGAGAAVPKADSWADPRDPNTDIAAEVRGLLAGVVLDADGRRAGNVGIQIEPADAQAGPAPPAPMSIVADAQGYFLTKGLKAGRAYSLTVRAESEGRTLTAVVQTRVPNPNLTIRLREDLSPSGPTTGPGGLPPTASPDRPPVPAGTAPFPPPADLAPAGDTTARPADGSWSPGAASAVPLHNVVPSPSPTPAPNSTPAGRPIKPENVAGEVRPDWRAPPASIPTPVLPPPIAPPPIAPAPANSSPARSQVVRPASNFVLVDSSNRPWTFDASRDGKLVLLDFTTTTCAPCRKSVPTLVALQARYATSGLQVIGVVCDEAPQAERATLAARYARDLNLNYGLYVEPGAEPGGVRDRFHVKGYPTAILLDESGAELWRGHPHGNGPQLEAAIRKYLGGQ